MTDPEFMDRAEALLRRIEACCDRINDETDADVDNHNTVAVDELHGAFQGLEGGDHFLDVGQFQTVLVENTQALLHQHVVIRDIPSGRFQRFDAGFFREGDPDFRDQNAFQIETCDFHRALLEFD